MVLVGLPFAFALNVNQSISGKTRNNWDSNKNSEIDTEGQVMILLDKTNTKNLAMNIAVLLNSRKKINLLNITDYQNWWTVHILLIFSHVLPPGHVPQFPQLCDDLCIQYDNLIAFTFNYLNDQYAKMRSHRQVFSKFTKTQTKGDTVQLVHIAHSDNQELCNVQCKRSYCIWSAEDFLCTLIQIHEPV